ncbi:hypothetical protein B9Z55_028181 [Caenorhabditis nigoni]|uniref:Protein kinase domain-containing protein n=1 Tax=Caenorhabditis nigoni TaxID=1611254 RepID=A0A2G5SD67_9PELO|nr:hypothetical protein B9Z55_028181 [Caenorhabditis nigoni]
MSISINDVLNNSYQVTELVNMGYFCVIYSALDLKTNRTVAVKMLKCEGESDLKAEFEYLMVLSPFEYCPTPLAFGEDPEDTSFFVLSMEGESLYELKFKNDNNKFSPKTTSLILFHALVALKSIHDAGIVHGDVTMMNIGLPKSLGKGRIILFDYGRSVPINPNSSRRDISDLLMVTGIASKENKTLTECRDAFENHRCTTVEELITMITEETTFDPDAPFDWELVQLD